MHRKTLIEYDIFNCTSLLGNGGYVLFWKFMITLLGLAIIGLTLFGFIFSILQL